MGNHWQCTHHRTVVLRVHALQPADFPCLGAQDLLSLPWRHYTLQGTLHDNTEWHFCIASHSPTA